MRSGNEIPRSRLGPTLQPAPRWRRGWDRSVLLAGLLVALAAPGTARALSPFQFDKREDLPMPAWSGNVQAGVNLNGGNTTSGGVSAEANVTRKSQRQRWQAGGNLNLSRTKVDVPHEQNGIPGIGPGELREETQTTRQAWRLHSRYDLFSGPHSSAYASASGEGDRPAGKELVLSGQIGWGLDLFHPENQVLRLELGYDFTREQPVLGRTLAIHSARLFLGYHAQIDERLSLGLEAEALTNLNAELPVGSMAVGRFQDTRLMGRLTATHKINHRLSLCLRLGASYDHAPPLRPPPPGTSFEPGYEPLAKRLDTTADLMLRLSF